MKDEEEVRDEPSNASDTFKVAWGLIWIAISGAAWIGGYTGPGAMVIIAAWCCLWFLAAGMKGATHEQ
jgi:hypothetical protein